MKLVKMNHLKYKLYYNIEMFSSLLLSSAYSLVLSVNNLKNCP